MSQYPSRAIVQKGAKPRKYKADTQALAFPKADIYRNPSLLALAKDQKCTLMYHHGGGHDTATVVACHSNQSKHGHGRGIKSHDCFIAFGCSNCHSILDSGIDATRSERVQTFAAAMRTTRARIMLNKKVHVAPEVDLLRARSDDDYWLSLWRDGLVKVI